MRLIDRAMVASVLHFDELIPLMRQTMIDFSCGEISQPTRRMLEVRGQAGYFGSMPAASEHALGAKLVTFFPHNAAKGLPTHRASIMLFSPHTGEALAVMDADLITEMRTAAVSAAFVDKVADSEVQSLAILGAGVQARSHLQALAEVRRFSDIRIANRTAQRARDLAAAVGARATHGEDAVRGAEVVVVATASSEPVLQGEWLREGATVVSVGWSGTEGAELDAATMSHTVIVDSREGVVVESGNIRRYNATIHGELGEVLNDTLVLEKGATVVFDSIGMAAQDLATAAHVYAKL